MSRMGGGMWRGGFAGGRSFGLHHHFDDDRPKVRASKAGFVRAWRYFRPYWMMWLVILACVAVVSAMTVLQPLCVREIINVAIPGGDTMLLGLLAAAMIGVSIVSGLITVLEQTLTARVSQGIMYDLRNHLYRHLQLMGLHFYTSNRAGEIISRVNNDVNAIQHVTTRTLLDIARNIFVLAATLSTMLSMNWRLTLMAAAVVPAFYLPSRIVGRIRRRLSTQTQEAQASMMGFLHERLHVGGALLMSIFGRRADDAQTFAERSATVARLHVKQSIVGRWLFMVLSAFGAAGPAIVFWYGGTEAMRGAMNVGDLVAFAALLGNLYRPMTHLATFYVDIQASFAVFDRIFEYIDTPPGVQDPPAPVDLPATSGHVVFENVCFSYPQPARPGGDDEAALNVKPREAFALRDVSFEMPPGQRVALVGPSGAGKTTITYLVPRFYDATSGRVTLDGVDLRDLAQEQLRRHVGMVTQETFLFHASIRENLLYARQDAGEDEMIAACQAANIHHFIAALPDGYDTVVGERGFRLSGGEKQRLSIARALLKDPTILILDEATSSLDATSEYLIQEALEKLLLGRTSLIIAHRLSTILSADLIVVMDAGRVVDVGRHEQLLERGGLYAQLFNQQFAKVLDLSQ